jgi:hypothetical protein
MIPAKVATRLRELACEIDPLPPGSEDLRLEVQRLARALERSEAQARADVAKLGEYIDALEEREALYQEVFAEINALLKKLISEKRHGRPRI